MNNCRKSELNSNLKTMVNLKMKSPNNFHTSLNTLLTILKNKDDILYKKGVLKRTKTSTSIPIREVSLLNRFVQCRDVEVPINESIIKTENRLFLQLHLVANDFEVSEGRLSNHNIETTLFFANCVVKTLQYVFGRLVRYTAFNVLLTTFITH